MKLKKVGVLIALTIGLGTISIASAFSDMPKEHWAYNKVEQMVDTGIITGYSDGTFKPDKPVTREEFATILTKTLELEVDEEIVDFRDIDSNRWSKQYIDAASKYLTGYLNNGNYYFYPELPAVREDMAVAVVKAKGLENVTPDYTVLDRFTDKDKISENLKKYIAIAVKNGIMSGNADGTFNPTGSLTRAEITALMCNVLEKVVIDEEVNSKSIYGDINGDGKVTMEDGDLLFKYSMLPDTYGKEVIEEVEKYGDVNKDGVLDIQDATIIKSYAEGKIDKLPHEHKYVNNKCNCGLENTAILYGDVNSDGYVTAKDRTILTRYIAGWEGYEEQVNKENADIFVDGKLDKMDYIVIGRYIAQWNIDFPHECGSYVVRYEKVDDQKHKEIYECKCGQVKDEEEIDHIFTSDKCICGLEQKIQEILYGDVNNDGKVNQLDVTYLKKYLVGEKTEIEKLVADVFLDNKIDNMDVIALRSFLAGGYIEKLPHECGSYKIAYVKNVENHTVVYECKCGKLKYEEEAKHEFKNSICECGVQELAEIYGDINGDGKITQDDSLLVFQYSMYPDVYGDKVIEEVEKYGDVNKDGVLDIQDSAIIQSYVEGKIDKLPHEHNYINNKCDCGLENTQILYGDVNSDGVVNGKDRTVLTRYIVGWEGYEEQVNKENADVFVDGKLDKMDYIVLGRYIAQWDMEFPHKCGKYTVEYERIDDEKHIEVYDCKCEQIKAEEEVEHEFEDDVCKCGFKDIEIDEDVLEAWNDLEGLGLVGDIFEYDLEESITKAEMAEIICKMTGVSKAVSNVKKNMDSRFSDVEKGEWYTGYINILDDNGLLVGFPDEDEFRPDDEINFNDTITFLINALGRGGYVEKMGKWPNNYITECARLGIADGVNGIDGEDPANMKNIVIMVKNTLDIPTWEVSSTTIDGQERLEEADSLREKYFD